MRAGTVAYMSPEMLQRGVMTMPADVYSFAMLMLELWVGDIVYKGVNSHQVRAHTTQLSNSLQHPVPLLTGVLSLRSQALTAMAIIL